MPVLGVFPRSLEQWSGSRWQDLDHRVFLLLWSELRAAEKIDVPSNKFAAVCCWLLSSVADLMRLLLPAGRGGEGKDGDGRAAAGPRVWRGWFAGLALRRGARRRLSGASIQLPWWKRQWRSSATGKREKGALTACPLNKRRRSSSAGLCGLLGLSASRGGEGGIGDCSWADGFWLRHGEFLASALPAAVLQRRPCLAAAIFGQRADPAVLDSYCCSSVLLLCVRIFFGLGAAVQALVLPSGVVPGEREGGCVLRLLVVGVELGLDRIFAVVLRVYSVIFQDYDVISFISGVLFVNVHPSPK